MRSCEKSLNHEENLHKNDLYMVEDKNIDDLNDQLIVLDKLLYYLNNLQYEYLHLYLHLFNNVNYFH